MTSESKLDPALTRKLQESSAEPIPVLIELQDQPRPGLPLDRGAEMDTLARAAAGAQGPLLDQLRQLGVPEAEIETHFLVNAVSCRLTAEQIATVAARDDVRMLRYGGTEDVALASDA